MKKKLTAGVDLGRLCYVDANGQTFISPARGKRVEAWKQYLKDKGYELSEAV